ncbi:recombinase family protein [Parvularcula lutaonensis]|uniref:Recombinase family protein n=1 Tax=Parvularcula lutaonensis TaxID=491923 RepID=A0ABV7MG57_9PROT|nr:hypothetical protein GCM10007148_28420 [Parvularcula lutaonensis]
MEIGCGRVSTAGQNLDRQIAALRAEGIETIFREKASGKSLKGRPELEKAIDALGTGDVLVIAEWDHATRSKMDRINILQRIDDRGALVRVLDREFRVLTLVMGKVFSLVCAPSRRTSASASSSVPARREWRP